MATLICWVDIDYWVAVNLIGFGQE